MVCKLRFPYGFQIQARAPIAWGWSLQTLTAQISSEVRFNPTDLQKMAGLREKARRPQKRRLGDNWVSGSETQVGVVGCFLLIAALGVWIGVWVPRSSRADSLVA